MPDMKSCFTAKSIIEQIPANWYSPLNIQSLQDVSQYNNNPPLSQIIDWQFINHLSLSGITQATFFANNFYYYFDGIFDKHIIDTIESHSDYTFGLYTFIFNTGALATGTAQTLWAIKPHNDTTGYHWLYITAPGGVLKMQGHTGAAQVSPEPVWTIEPNVWQIWSIHWQNYGDASCTCSFWKNGVFNVTRNEPNTLFPTFHAVNSWMSVGHHQTKPNPYARKYSDSLIIWANEAFTDDYIEYLHTNLGGLRYGNTIGSA